MICFKEKYWQEALIWQGEGFDLNLLSPQPDIAKGSRLRRQHRDCFQVHLLSAGYSCTFSNWEELLWHALRPRPPVVDSMLSFSPQGIQTMLLYIPDKSTNEVNNNKKEWKKKSGKRGIGRDYNYLCNQQHGACSSSYCCTAAVAQPSLWLQGWAVVWSAWL